LKTQAQIRIGKIPKGAGSLLKQEVRSRIEEIGIVPLVRVSKTEDALFAAEAVAGGGIPIVEITLTVPDAVNVISHLARNSPELIVGAGSVSDIESARCCLDAGAKFLSSDGFDPETIGFAVHEDAVVIPGTLTPTDILAAWKLSPDFIKIVPCGHIGGASYIRYLKAMFPKVPLIAAGGIDQRSAFDFIRAGAVALAIGGALIPREAIRQRQSDQIAELAHRFLQSVSSAREQFGGSLMKPVPGYL
jgi:2-dehydro-3-deoxyphosphogluconate aldolase/(4S)-4-hydroxy-2-oxoglutarate aldolase